MWQHKLGRNEKRRWRTCVCVFWVQKEDEGGNQKMYHEPTTVSEGTSSKEWCGGLSSVAAAFILSLMQHIRRLSVVLESSCLFRRKSRAGEWIMVHSIHTSLCMCCSWLKTYYVYMKVTTSLKEKKTLLNAMRTTVIDKVVGLWWSYP